MSESTDALFEQARRLDDAGDAEGAARLYRRVLAGDPGDFRAHNNLGLVLADAGDLGAGLKALLAARDAKADEASIYFNIGNVLQQQERYDSAVDMYRLCLELGGNSAAVLYNMAGALENVDRDSEAERCYRQAAELAPSDHRIVSNLGAVLLRDSRVLESLACFREAVRLNPESALDHFNVAKVLDDLGETEEAAAAYRESLALNPTADSCRYRLIAMLERTGQTQAAKTELDTWLRLFPNSATAQHLSRAFEGDVTTGRASPDYIRETFDGFADSFEQTLAKLRYRAPALIADALGAEAGEPRRALRILDLGCGTGLSGEAVRPWAAELVGLDLSDEMIQKAEDKKIYDRLVGEDLEDFLGRADEPFDAIIAADTLCYFGALEEVTGLAARALRPGGLLAFTLERAADETCPGGFEIKSHGRYCHTRGYASGVLEQAGLRLRSAGEAVLRSEAGSPVDGLVIVAALDADGSSG